MQQKTKTKWFISSLIIAIISFWLPGFVREMYQKGNLPENITVPIVMASVPVGFLAVVLTVSFLILLFLNKNK